MNNILTVLRFGWTYLRRYWMRLAFGVLFGFVFALANGSFIWATRTLSDRFSDKSEIVVVQTQSTKAVPGLTDRVKVQFKELGQQIQTNIDPWLPRIGQPLNWRQIAGLLLFLPLLVVVRSGADYLNNYCIGWVSERVIRDIRLDVMEKLSTLSLDFFTRSTTGDLLTRINVDTQTLLRALRQGVSDLIKESLTVIVVFIGLLCLDWKLTLAVMVVLPACLLPLIILGMKARRAMVASLKANISQSSQLVELLGGIRVIKAYNLEASEMERFRKTSGQLVHAGMKGVQAKELINPIIEIISMLGLGALLLYIFHTGRSGSDLVGFITGVLFVFLPIKRIAAVHIIFEQASVGAARLMEILAEQPKVVEATSPKPVADFNKELRFDNVTFAYVDKTVLSDFSLVIPRGWRLGIAGESGSGKTTLVNLLFRFYDPTQGVITIDGLNLRAASLKGLRNQLALVSQDVTIFDQTIAENIGCGRPGSTRAEIEAAAKEAFAHEFIAALPQGYDTRVGERGVTLSGGQKQRVAIARAFVRNAPILVLDEATAALDSKAEAEVQVAIDRLSENRTVICVAHRLSTLATCNEVIVLTQGRLVERGPYQELLKKADGAFAVMASKQGIFATS